MEERPHNVLAAEDFSVGTGDPGLRHRPVAPPDAPFSEGEPAHDVLAAEEFAMPAGRSGVIPAVQRAGSDHQLRLLAGGAVGGLAAVLTLRARRRR